MKNKYKKLKDLVEVREVSAARYVHNVVLPYLQKNNVPYEIIDKPECSLRVIDPDVTIIRTYPGDNDIRLIGKGVVYDSGGYNLKPDPKDMFFDKAGACVALYLSVTKGIPATVGFMNNMINDRTKYVPGSVMKIGNKKVLITDTDAEGRLLLAELLSIESNETKCIAIGTLTGHAAYVVGEGNGALVHSDDMDLKVKCLTSELTLHPAPDYKVYSEKANKKPHRNIDLRNWVGPDNPDSMLAYNFLKNFRESVTLVDMAAECIENDFNYSGWGPEEITFIYDHFNNIRVQEEIEVDA